MPNPLNQLAKLRRFQTGMDVDKYLSGEFRMNLKAIEDAFRKLSPAQQTSAGSSVVNAQLAWQDIGPINVTALTTNPTKGNVSRDSLKYRLDGPDAIIRVDYAQLAGTGASGSGDYLINIPSDIGKIDLNIVPAHTGSGQPIAQCSSWIGCINCTNTVSVLQGYVIVYSETQVRVCGLYAAAASNFWTSTNAHFGTDLYFSGEFRIPLKAA